MPAKSPRCQASRNVAAVPSGSGVLAVTLAVGGGGAVGSGPAKPEQAAKKRERDRKREKNLTPPALLSPHRTRGSSTLREGGRKAGN